MSVSNLALDDYGKIPIALGPNFQTAFNPAVVSFDVKWSGPITRSLCVTDSTHPDQFTGEYLENQATVTWSGTNLATGFSFTANPGDFSTSAPGRAFAELGHEQNGSFFSSDSSTDRAFAPPLMRALPVQSLAKATVPASPVPAESLRSPPQALGVGPPLSAALPTASSAPASVAPVAKGHPPAISTDPGGSDLPAASRDLGGELLFQ
jgi:hypothetical protein